jgi:hypothetical protein
LDSLSSIPLCCDYCEQYYDEICSYRKFDQNGVPGPLLRMSQDLLKVTSLLTQCDAKSYVQNEKCCNLTRAAQSSLRAMIVGGADTEGTGQFIDNQ